jgi:hypothetical protein
MTKMINNYVFKESLYVNEKIHNLHSHVYLNTAILNYFIGNIVKSMLLFIQKFTNYNKSNLISY